MRNSFKTILWMFAALILIDLSVAAILSGPAPQSVKQLFDYGRSVPGKLDQWSKHPDMPGNMQNMAWIPDVLALSAESFSEEENITPVLRSYGMSFVNDIVRSAEDLRSELSIDLHSGPAAPPNFTYSIFLADRDNRRAGDIVILGILSSSVPGMGSFSNRVWSFEQPAPYTYPVYRPASDGGLIAELPVVQTAQQEAARQSDAALNAQWQAQLRTTDSLYTPAAFAAPILDRSPFLRVIRRSWATGAIEDKKQAFLTDEDVYPYAEVLVRMARQFTDMAREDGQIPLVVLVQSRDLSDPQLDALLAETLVAQGIPFLSTTAIQSHKDARAFIADGHYTKAVNRRFAQAMLDYIDQAMSPQVK